MDGKEDENSSGAETFADPNSSVEGVGACGYSGSSGESDQTMFLSHMECPVCCDVVLPIFQCRNGHIICGLCWHTLDKKICPSCRIECDEPTRNLALEQILKECKVKLPCKFSDNGCEEKMFYREKEAHLAICQFKTYVCPLRNNNCRWEGRLDQIVDHLKGRSRHSHGVPVLNGETATFFFPTDPPAVLEDTNEAILSIQVQVCFEKYFLITFGTIGFQARTAPEYCALVQIVGNKDDAVKFAYRLELEKDGRRMSWEAVPLPISANVRFEMDIGDCLAFSLKTSKFFQNGDIELLPIDVTISKVL